MRIAIVGAGIIGVTTAFELAADGHAVTVFERRSAAAEETSFANAGLVAPGYITPWAAPGMPSKVLGHLFSRHAPVRLRWPLSGAELRWVVAWWRACRPETHLANRGRMQRLAFFSHARLRDITRQLSLAHDRSEGVLVLFRSEKERLAAQGGLALLREAQVRFRELDEAGARVVEPALNPDTRIAGAIELQDDEVGNCRQFAQMLKAAAQHLGARFEFNAPVARIASGEPTALWLRDEGQPREFDAIVVCAALGAIPLLAPMGLHLPMAAVHGYSISATVRQSVHAPRSAIMDERFKVAIARMGNRVRVAGSAELGGRLERHHAGAIATLHKVLRDWFPGAVQMDNGVQVWKGARPMMPDGPPVIGSSGHRGIWLNLGHGSSGWALSCGSARVVADVLAGRPAPIALDGLGIERLKA
jgi:D-amino-acid dehydrogenase